MDESTFTFSVKPAEIVLSLVESFNYSFLCKSVKVQFFELATQLYLAPPFQLSLSQLSCNAKSSPWHTFDFIHWDIIALDHASYLKNAVVGGHSMSIHISGPVDSQTIPTDWDQQSQREQHLLFPSHDRVECSLGAVHSNWMLMIAIPERATRLTLFATICFNLIPKCRILALIWHFRKHKIELASGSFVSNASFSLHCYCQPLLVLSQHFVTLNKSDWVLAQHALHLIWVFMTYLSHPISHSDTQKCNRRWVRLHKISDGMQLLLLSSMNN